MASRSASVAARKARYTLRLEQVEKLLAAAHDQEVRLHLQQVIDGYVELLSRLDHSQPDEVKTASDRRGPDSRTSAATPS